MLKPKVSLIVAASKNRVIGINNTLPWRLSADLVYFKSVTMGKPIIMGRKTFDSIGRPLPGRPNIVVTRQTGWSADGVDAVHSLDEAVSVATQKAGEASEPEVVIIGGANLYEQAIPLCDVVYMTEVDCTIEGDAFFPVLNSSEWEEASRTHNLADEKNAYNCDFVVLRRKQ